MLAVLFHVTLGLAVVLLLRQLVRRLFGAGPAFTLWMIPPLFAALPLLPAMAPSWTLVPTLHVAPAARALLDHAAPSAAGMNWLALAWSVGSLGWLLKLLFGYRALLQQLKPVPEETWLALRGSLQGVTRRRLWLHADGPAVVCARRTLLVLPENFLQRFNVDERRLILRHELTHMRRGDPLWTVLANLAAALLWFHPLAWMSLSRFRLDQELACDERVLQQLPHDEARYAHVLLHSAGHVTAPALIPWLHQPQLKERLKMIERQRVSSLRRRIGYPVLVVAIATCAVSVQARPFPQAPLGASSNLSYNARLQPRYPQVAVQQKQQGMVMLMVLVDPQGNVQTVDYDPKGSTTTSASLIGAASDAAFKWHFKPAVENGKPIQSYARVPVLFDLREIPDRPPTSAAASNSTSS